MNWPKDLFYKYLIRGVNFIFCNIIVNKLLLETLARSWYVDFFVASYIYVFQTIEPGYNKSI